MALGLGVGSLAGACLQQQQQQQQRQRQRQRPRAQQPIAAALGHARALAGARCPAAGQHCRRRRRSPSRRADLSRDLLPGRWACVRATRRRRRRRRARKPLNN
eukprot:scaffold3328_cov247-Prasinococcus_capsulatus_cf.AAC.5